MPGRWTVLVFAIACVGISAGCSTSAQKASGSDDRTGLAVEFVQCLVDGKFADAAAHFDSKMSSAMSADGLKQTWEALIGQCGAFKRMGDVRTTQEGGFDVVLVACEFERTTLDVKIVYDKDGKIGGLWFVPHVAGDKAQYTTPAYAHKDSFDELEVIIGSGEWKLPGTLTVPKGAGPFPGVVLVHGSGPNDRDESLGPNKPFRDLAWGLASRGIAVLRYDKRTKVYANKIAGYVNTFTVKEEVIDDAIAAVKMLRGSKKIDPKRVFVLGHSLGGMFAPRIGKADPKIAGLIVMAGPTRPLEDIILDQIIYLSSLDGPPSPEAEKRISETRRQVAGIKSAKLSSSAAASSLFGVPAAYWLDLRGYHPAQAAKSLNQPMLILQGGRDYQVTEVEYDGWLKALSGRPNVAFKLYPSLNHLFMEGAGKSTPQEYDKRGPVSQTVIDDIAAWISAH